MAPAQPKVDANALTLTLGLQADSRIIASENKPSCPFPAKVEIVPPLVAILLAGLFAAAAGLAASARPLAQRPIEALRAS